MMEVQVQQAANIDTHSHCSSNTQANCNSNSNSGSVRSLLTEKLRQFAQEDLQDPENKHERLVIQGNLMKELSKCSRASKPLLVSRKFQDLSEPFSMQNKRSKQGEQNWPRKIGERVQSQRTILGQINLSQDHFREKRAKKDEEGCARCEIY